MRHAKSKIIAILVVVSVVAFGLQLLLASHAATPYVAAEAETGTVNAPATITSDTTASLGSAVTFHGGTVPHTAACGWGSVPAHYSHVVWIWMENKDQSAVIGKAPYIDSVKSACGSATNVQDTSTSAALPSEPEYAAGTSGSNCNSGINTTGSNCITDNNDYGASNSLTTTSIFQLVKNAGGSWKSYQEAMPSNCDLTSSPPLYVYKHNPAAFYSNMHADCAANDIGFPAVTCNASSSMVCSPPSGVLYSDIKNGTLATYSFITPDMNNSMHDGTVIEGDNWLSTYLPLIIAGPNYQAGNTAVFVMWDEGSSNTSPSSTAIPSLAIAPSIKPGTTASLLTNDIGFLKTTEEMLGLTPYLGCASGTPPGNVGGCGAGSSVSIRTALGL